MEIATLGQAVAKIWDYVVTLDKTVSVNEAKIHLQTMILDLQQRVFAVEEEKARLKLENDQHKAEDVRRVEHRAEKAHWQVYQPTAGVFVYAASAVVDGLGQPYDGSRECFCRNCSDQHDRKSVFQRAGHDGGWPRYVCPACGMSFAVVDPAAAKCCAGTVPMPRSDGLVL